MKKNGKKILAAVGSVVMAAGMLAGCGSSSPETTTAAKQTTKAAEQTDAKTEAAKETADLSGSISMVGSTSMEKFANALSEIIYGKVSGRNGTRRNLSVPAQALRRFWAARRISVIPPET